MSRKKKIKKTKKKIKKTRKNKEKIVGKKLVTQNIYKSSAFKTDEEKLKSKKL